MRLDKGQTIVNSRANHAYTRGALIMTAVAVFSFSYGTIVIDVCQKALFCAVGLSTVTWQL
jgi:hypothetical protein